MCQYLNFTPVTLSVLYRAVSQILTTPYLWKRSMHLVIWEDVHDLRACGFERNSHKTLQIASLSWCSGLLIFTHRRVTSQHATLCCGLSCDGLSLLGCSRLMVKSSEAWKRHDHQKTWGRWTRWWWEQKTQALMRCIKVQLLSYWHFSCISTLLKVDLLSSNFHFYSITYISKYLYF